MVAVRHRRPSPALAAEFVAELLARGGESRLVYIASRVRGARGVSHHPWEVPRESAAPLSIDAAALDERIQPSVEQSPVNRSPKRLADPREKLGGANPLSTVAHN